MAFNPFEKFRNNGKVLFAILTIVIMFTFVLSSGMGQGADFFDWLPKVMGSKGAKAGTVAQIYGSAQSQTDLEAVRKSRALANNYMLRASDKARISTFAKVDEAIKGKELSEEVARELQQVMQLYALIQNPQFARQIAGMLGQSTEKLRTMLVGIDKSNRPRDAEAISALLTGIDLLLGGSRRSPDLYFDTVGTTSMEGLADFSLFLQRADKMGIVMTPEVTKKAISAEFGGTLTTADRVDIERALAKEFKGLTADALLEALSREFRVRQVIQSTFGYDDRRGGNRTYPPFYTTPFEFQQYFKDNQTRFNLSMIEIPVEGFVPQVTEKPTDEDLDKLFAEFAKAEANPAVETPGFRDPRKIRIEWISPALNLALYAKTLPTFDAVSQIAAGFASTSAGTGVPVVAVSQILAPIAARNFAWTNVQMVSFREQGQNDPMEWSSPFAFAARRDMTQSPPTSIGVAAREAVLYTPAALTSLLGHLIGGSSPVRDLSAQGAYRHMVETIEIRDRVRAGLPRLLGLASPYAGSLTILAPSIGAMPSILPLEFFKRENAKEIRNNTLSNIVAKDFEGFRTNVLELAKVKDAGVGAKKYIDEFLLARPELKRGAMKTARDAFAIGDDEAIALLKENQTILPGDPLPWNVFYDLDSNGQPIQTRGAKPPSLYQPTWFPNGTTPGTFDTPKPLFLTWRIEDVLSKQYATYAAAPQEIKAKVVYAWKFERARDLAKKAAEELEAKVRTAAAKYTASDDFRLKFLPEVRDLAGKNYRLVEPDVISPLSFAHPTDPRANQSQAGWTAYQFKTTDMLYPTPEATEKLLNLRKEKLGSTTIVSDRPKKNLYVATLFTKIEPGMPEFMRVFSRSAPDNPTRDTMYSQNATREAQIVLGTELRKRVQDAAGFKLDEEYFKKDRRNRAEDDGDQ